MIEDLILVFQEKMPNDSHLIFNDQVKIDFKDFVSVETPEVWKSHPSEYTLNLICDRIKGLSKINEIKGILIDLGIGDKSRKSNIAVDLAIHCRLSNILLPIIVINESYPTDNHLINIPISSYETLFDFGVAKFLTYSQTFDRTKSIESAYPIYENLPEKFNLTNFLEKFEPKQSSGRHQVTNEWGAVKLALNAGYTTNDIDYDFPLTLYFKYLKSKYQINQLDTAERQDLLTKLNLRLNPDKIDLSSLLTYNNILLIDDNSEKGWKSVIQTIFSSHVMEIKSVKEALKITDYTNYDLVFLDLYIPNVLKDNVPDMEHSKILLNALKKRYPQIPIIVFTASNKSWTLNEVMELGADGMYVKEAPEYAGDSQYSKENFKFFLNTVVLCLKQYKILRPFWEKIVEIKSNFLPEINDSALQMFKSRIEERLDMFYGLLKQGFEQKTYNVERFYFSDYELAFITLWSILNEVSEAMYEKIPVIIRYPILSINDQTGKPISKHPNRTHDNITPYPTSDEEWLVRNQSEFLFNYNYSFKGFEPSGDPKRNLSGNYYLIEKTTNSNLKFDDRLPPYYNLLANNFNPNKTLHCQIAYLLLVKNQFRLSSKINQYLNSLKILNDTRNSLYLTHGDNLTTGFYNKTEKQKRVDGDHDIKPEIDIKTLFELTAFLLTGNEIDITF